MKKRPTAHKNVFEIRKYPNRRFYNATHSRHLTLEEIRNLVKGGQEVRITDNRTGADITAKVLAQIILDLDAPKLNLFPVPFLAEIIRVNDLFLMGFYEKFFQQALRAFQDFQQTWELRMKEGNALPFMFPPMTAWSQALANSVGSMSGKPSNGGAQAEQLSGKLMELQRQLVELQAELAKSRKSTFRRDRRKSSQ